MSKLALQLIAKANKEKAKVLDLGNCGLTELPKGKSMKTVNPG